MKFGMFYFSAIHLKIFANFPWDFVLAHELFRTVLFNFQMFGVS